ncbi:MAG: ribosome assembly cofactor RimP [Bacteroidetes bacterium MedPE-SWsnd-G2]|nr:MAG: ribosome assembly cofactor RimP [Bacteroidetes bacterium MedPE-SWsnd-G2]
MFKEKVRTLLNEALEERQDLFLISFEVKADNAIFVEIDGDNGVLVEDCMFVSRAIEHNLDREEEDFSLEVTSAGAASVFTHQRQYTKNIGRNVEVKMVGGSTQEGVLKETSESGIILEWKTREPKPVGKGKVTVIKNETVDFKDIIEAKVIIKF